MSGGDHNDPFPVSYDVTRRIFALPIVVRMMRRPYTVNATQWDIPYLAGYSKDGRTIYIDRDLGDWHYMGKTINCDRYLILHEYVEKSLIDAIEEASQQSYDLMDLLHMISPDSDIYYHTHGVATAAEEHMVRLQYGDGVAAYNHFMGTQVKRAEDERIRRVPWNLDMTPYQGKDAMDVRLRRVMEARMAA